MNSTEISRGTYTGHSFWIGAATTAATNGVPYGGPGVHFDVATVARTQLFCTMFVLLYVFFF